MRVLIIIQLLQPDIARDTVEYRMPPPLVTLRAQLGAHGTASARKRSLLPVRLTMHGGQGPQQEWPAWAQVPGICRSLRNFRKPVHCGSTAQSTPLDPLCGLCCLEAASSFAISLPCPLSCLIPRPRACVYRQQGGGMQLSTDNPFGCSHAFHPGTTNSTGACCPGARVFPYRQLPSRLHGYRVGWPAHGTSSQQ
jgi:hypothetical protein